MYKKTTEVVAKAVHEESVIWIESDITNNYEPVLNFLQSLQRAYIENTAPNAIPINAVSFNLNLRTALERFNRNADGFYGGFTDPNMINYIETNTANKKRRCGISLKVMRNPVYILDKNNVKHYFDLIPLLVWLSEHNILPTARQSEDSTVVPQTVSVLDIHFDAELKREIATAMRDQLARAPMLHQALAQRVARAAARPEVDNKNSSTMGVATSSGRGRSLSA